MRNKKNIIELKSWYSVLPNYKFGRTDRKFNANTGCWWQRVYYSIIEALRSDNYERSKKIPFFVK